jgi:hypothetical protein
VSSYLSGHQAPHTWVKSNVTNEALHLMQEMSLLQLMGFEVLTPMVIQFYLLGYNAM